MAEKNFFNLLKEKMAALRPSTRHREEDWAALTERLDQALPRQPKDRRRVWAPLLLLFLAFLLSNAFWWQESRENRVAMQRVERQLAGLQTALVSTKPAPPVVRTDTVWRTVYIRIPDSRLFAAPLPMQSKRVLANNDTTLKTPAGFDARRASNRLTPKDDSLQQKFTGVNPGFPGEPTHQPEYSDPGQDTAAKTTPAQALALPEWAFLRTSRRQAPFIPGYVVDSLIPPYKPTHPLGPVLLNALKPKYFKIGVSAGWLHPLSPALMHQVGYEAGVQGVIGFSRHWSLTLEYAYGKLHYESDKPEAILGSPEFPALPSSDHFYAHLNLQRQPLRQFGLGLRYTFSEWGKTHPYMGLSWGNQTVLPYQVEYEVQHEPSNTIQPAILFVDKTTRLRNVLRLGAGLEVPLSRRFDLTIEGFYLRQWKEKNKEALDLGGLRLGANWAF